MRAVVLAVLTILAFLHAAAAEAQTPESLVGQTNACRVRIETSAGTWVIRGFDPFGSSPAIATYQVTFLNEGQSACRFRPVFDLIKEPYGLSAGGGARLSYTLLDLSSGIDLAPIGGRSLLKQNASWIVLASGAQQVVNYSLRVSTDIVSTDGLFAQTVEMQAEQADGSIVGGRQLILGLDVLPSAVLGLSGTYRTNGGRALVDFGELTEGLAPTLLQLNVDTTRSYTLSFASQNNGQLRIAGTGWAVPYQMSVGGQSVQLEGGSAEVRGPATKGLHRYSLPMQFRVGDPRGQRAGTYTDVISVTVAPL